MASPGRSSDRLTDDPHAWGKAEYPRYLVGDHYVVRTREPVSWRLLHALALLKPTTLGLHQDLSSLDRYSEEDDIGVVHRVPFTEHDSVIVKRVKPDRVSTIYQEPFAAHAVAAAGVPAVDILAVLEPKSSGDSPLLVMHDLREHTSLRTVLHSMTEPASMDPRVVGHLNKIAYQVGKLLRRLYDAGIDYQDFDPKNILIRRPLEASTLVFCDFERTRILRQPTGWGPAVEMMSEPFARRLRRLPAWTGALEHSFTQGILYPEAGLRTGSLSNAISAYRQITHRPIVVAIDGLAGSGKSTLASALHAQLEDSVVVETDWFVRYDRETRQHQDFARDHRAWYDFRSLREYLAMARRPTSSRIHIERAYSHESGAHDLTVDLILTDRTVILLEGMYSAGDEVRPEVDLRFVLTPRRTVARAQFVRRDAARAGSDPDHAAAREASINTHAAQRHVAKVQSAASVTLDHRSSDCYSVSTGSLSFLRHLELELESALMDDPNLDVCPFCSSDEVPGRVLISGDFQAIYNQAPVVPGHVLIAPLRHVTSLADLTSSGRAEFMAFAFDVTQLVVTRTRAAGFDWALQDGVVAGQTVGHLHLHILPRQESDLDRPGAWFTSLFGPSADAPESDERPVLSREELLSSAAWIRDG